MLGRSLARMLIASGVNVFGVTRPNTSKNIDDVRSIEIDLSENWDTEVLPERIDCIFHLAQSSKFRDFPENALDFFNVNLNSTSQLLDYAKDFQREHSRYSSLISYSTAILVL